MKYFDSYKDYLHFSMAREFVYKTDNSPFSYKENLLEKAGSLFSGSVLNPADFILKNMENPLFITAVVVASLALTTFVFYPALIPSLKILTVHLKLGTFLLIESTILGIGLRTLGRLSNLELMSRWASKRLDAVNLGAIILPT